MFSMLDQLGGVEGSVPSYPPYDIEQNSKNASICRSSNTSVLAKELPNYRFFFLAKIAFQLSL